MIENKIPVFAGLPDSELSKLSDTKPGEKATQEPRSIEKEFEQTNLHTKQTQDSGHNTDNTDNNAANDANDPNNTGVVAKEKKNRLGKLMGGMFAVDLVDMLIPSLVVLLMNYLGYIMEKKDLQLSKSEKEALAPAVQDVLDDINIDFDNPYINLAVMVSIVYGSKIIDKLPTIKKKSKPIPKKGMSEAIAETLAASGEEGEEISDIEKFEIDYGKLVDDIRISRKRGVGDAKEYLCNNYPEKIKAVAKKYGIALSKIQDKLEYVHTVKKRKPGEDFEMPN